MRQVMQAFVVLFVASASCATEVDAQPTTAPPSARTTPRTDLTPEEQRTIRIFEGASQAVVFVTNLAVQQDIFNRNVSAEPRGSGSGFVWDRRGHIVTNYHVIRGANAVHITLAPYGHHHRSGTATSQK